MRPASALAAVAFQVSQIGLSGPLRRPAADIEEGARLARRSEQGRMMHSLQPRRICAFGDRQRSTFRIPFADSDKPALCRQGAESARSRNHHAAAGATFWSVFSTITAVSKKRISGCAPNRCATMFVQASE
jgi:hypothetical protein